VIYLDLRLLSGVAGLPTLHQMIDIALQSSWQSDHRDMDADTIIDSVRNHQALIIFDGLDEVGTHFDEDQNRRFIRELFSILPPHIFDSQNRDDPKSGKLIIACRSEFFRNTIQQNAMLTLQGRDGIEKRDYKAFVMLPFNDEQIYEYLQKNLSDGDEPQKLQKVIDLIHSIHNLTELSKRPFNLKLITEQIPKLEKLLIEGRVVASVNLYETLIDSWLERDSGKHRIDRVLKKELMEYLAFSLWRANQKSWGIDDVERWFEKFMRDRGEWEVDSSTKEMFKEDLRTATFIAREGSNRFRFAHTSLQEYFLASYIFGSLSKGDESAFSLPRPSSETFDFLAQIIAQKESRDRVEETLEEIYTLYRPTISDHAFELLLHLDSSYLSKGFLCSEDIDLNGINLDAKEINGSTNALQLNGIKLTNASLRQTRWQNIELLGADFSSSDLTHSRFYDTKLNASNFSDTDLTAVRFLRSSLYGADFSMAKVYDTEYIESPIYTTEHLPNDLAQCYFAPFDNLYIDTPTRGHLDKAQFYLGHSGSVNSVAFSSDDLKIISGSWDNTVRIWDSSSGRELTKLEGHSSSVNSVAFSSDDSKIISGSEDKTIRIWDSSSGRELMRSISYDGGYASYLVDSNTLVAVGDDIGDYVGWQRLGDGNHGVMRLPPQMEVVE